MFISANICFNSKTICVSG